MPVLLARNWWSLVIRGLLAIAFGVLTFIWPGITLAVLVLLFGAYALIDGVMNLAGLFTGSRPEERWWALLLEGIAGIAAGLITFFVPGITALALVFVIAAWAFVTGIFELVAAVRLRKQISGEWLLVLSGIASLILGVLFAAVPIAGALAVAFTVGVYAIIFGVLMLSLGLRLRSWAHTFPGGAMPLPAH
jgi:uncharacterized membrane protein HdeD (DUF308 family)